MFNDETYYFHNFDYICIELFMNGGGVEFKNQLCYNLQVSLGLQVLEAGL
jgi:hypothetical protein